MLDKLSTWRNWLELTSSRNQFWVLEFGVFTDTQLAKKGLTVFRSRLQKILGVLVAAHVEFGIYNYPLL